MGRIKKLKETDLVGGAQSTDVYPITSTLAVYDEQNKVLEDYLTHLRNTATFVGIAIPETNPGTPTSKVFYIAKEKGTYRYFGKVITEDEVIILLWDSATWRKLSTGIASQKSLIELNGIKETIKIGVITTANLINPDNWQVGYVNNNGFLDTSESYRYQEIDIRELDTATLLNCITDANASAPARFYCFKNDAMGNGEKISGGQSSSSFSVPEGATRLFVSFSNAFLSDKLVGVFAGESPTWEPYIAPFAYPYGQWGDADDGNAIARKKDIAMSNPLYGKKWVACGDSFTAGAFTGSHTDDYIFKDGKYAGQMKVYPYFIGNRNEGLVVVNEAIGGSTITSGTGKSPFSDDRVLNIPSDADYITLRFGINDTSSAVPMGTIDSTDKTTFYGAWNYVLDYLTTNFPYAKIGIIVGEGMQNADGQEYAKAEIEVAKKWGIPYLNIQFESGGEKIPLTFRTSNPNVSSTAIQKKFTAFVVDADTNWHPNEKAHEYESTFIEAWLKSL